MGDLLFNVFMSVSWFFDTRRFHADLFNLALAICYFVKDVVTNYPLTDLIPTDLILKLSKLSVLPEAMFHFSKDAFTYYYPTNPTLVFTVKLALCLVFLSAMRGGVPRYRYDFLTKMGWVKFLGYVLSVFITVLCLFIIW